MYFSECFIDFKLNAKHAFIIFFKASSKNYKQRTASLRYILQLTGNINVLKILSICSQKFICVKQVFFVNITFNNGSKNRTHRFTAEF